MAIPEQQPSMQMSADWWKNAWDSFRCRKCQKLLLKIHADALRPSKAIEVKCGGCKTLNYLMGA